MVMRAGTRTSIHLHRHHDTHLEGVSGKCWINRFSDDLQCSQGVLLTAGDHMEVPRSVLHEIHATTDCVIRERYSAVGCGTSIDPIDDIERMSHTELCQAYGMWDDNTNNPLIKGDRT